MIVIDAQVHIWSNTVVPTFGLHRKVAAFSADELSCEMEGGRRSGLDSSAGPLGSRFKCVRHSSRREAP
jgi:hypothetical protein